LTVDRPDELLFLAQFAEPFAEKASGSYACRSTWAAPVGLAP